MFSEELKIRTEQNVKKKSNIRKAKTSVRAPSVGSECGAGTEADHSCVRNLLEVIHATDGQDSSMAEALRTFQALMM